MWQEIITYILVGAAAIALFWRLFGRFFRASKSKDENACGCSSCSDCSACSSCSACESAKTRKGGGSDCKGCE
ncbi:MAG: hypothetical protein IJ280_04320 [Bacteroidales bacterium]|nr:hypothetical protein [Bacteroidales bacterium]